MRKKLTIREGNIERRGYQRGYAAGTKTKWVELVLPLRETIELLRYSSDNGEVYHAGILLGRAEAEKIVQNREQRIRELERENSKLSLLITDGQKIYGNNMPFAGVEPEGRLL